jgi:hypothetical protein
MTDTFYTVKIVEVTKIFEIARMAIRHGNDVIRVVNGKDIGGQLWSWVEIERTQIDAGTFTMSKYGLARATNANESRIELILPRPPKRDPKMPNANRRKAAIRREAEKR